jgi:hypothetical protein
MKIKPPILGLDEGSAACEQPSQTSFSLKNTRPYDITAERIRFGQRPGTTKAYTTQISGASHPVLAIVSVISTYIQSE